MYYEDKLWIGTDSQGAAVNLFPAMANRHGLITGATGTGKTTTLKVMAESFSALGVPVFLSDIKGDLSGICKPGEQTDKMENRLDELGVPAWEYAGFPTRYWDVFGEKGHPVRATISDMGPSHLARLLSLSEVQEGVLNLVFHIADERGLLLLDLKDLRLMLSYCAEHRTEFTTDYGNMSAQSIGAIQRSLLTLENEGGDIFFGEPALDIQDWIMCDEDGRGFVNILCADKLVQSPLLYSTFLLWMLSELYEKLPEEGDLEIPKMVFFFDEAHLLFKDAPKALLDKVTQIVKLIRSKGVGIYFISQSPGDIPDEVQGQLQNRVQHALHAYTPAEQKAVKVAASTLRPNPDFDTEEIISNLGVGEALLSFLDEGGVPQIVQKARILPPQSYMAPVDDETRKAIIEGSEMEELYRDVYDRESAYEILTAEKQEEERRKAEEAAIKEQEAEERRREKQVAAEIRRAEQEAARLDRERRRQEAAMIRELGRTSREPSRPARTSTTRSTSYSSPRTTARRTAASYDRDYDTASRRRTRVYDETPAPMPPVEQPRPRRERPVPPPPPKRERPVPPPKPEPVQRPIPPEDGLAGIGRAIDRTITRGLFGNRRW